MTRATLMLVLGLAVVTASAAQDAAAPAGHPSMHEFARSLVDHPGLSVGDADAAAHDWIDRIETDPGHMLTEAALIALSEIRGELADPAALDERLLALSPDGMNPMARRSLELLQGFLLSVRSPLEDLPARLFDDTAADFRLLAPLGPAGHPGALTFDAHLFDDPGFDRDHDPGLLGMHEPVRWRAVSRHPLRPALTLGDLVRPASGWALLATELQVSRAGQAWLELDTVQGGGAVQRRGDRSYAWKLNDGPVQVVDMLGAPRAPLTRVPVTLRAGTNRLMLRASLETSPAFMLRVRLIAPDGRAIPLVGVGAAAPAADTPAPGDVLGAAPPPTSLDMLAALDDRGPYGDAVMGWLLGLEGREPESVASLAHAVQRAPRSANLKMMLAEAMDKSWHLPVVWRRGRARELAEAALAEDPGHLVAAVYLASQLAAEDREQEAIELLSREGDPPAGRWRRLLALRRLELDLDMIVNAEQALYDALDLAPRCPGLLTELDRHLSRAGLGTRALEAGHHRLRLGGPSLVLLSELSRRHAVRGELDIAEALLHEAQARFGAAEFALAGLYADTQRYAEADALFAALADEHPRWNTPVIRRADLAHLTGDRMAEEAHLREALRRDPSQRNVRERLAALRGESVPSLAARYGLGSAAVRGSYHDAGSADSIVRVLDEAVVEVFADGGYETTTHEIHHLRDLAATKRMGELQLRGDVLEVRTIKADGTLLEPVNTGSYVMPHLQPGDFVETRVRTVTPPPRDGVVRLGGWFFQSTAEPFWISRYVVSVPKSLPLRLEQHRFDGLAGAVHEVIDEGDRVVHVFEARDMPRVIDERFSPPARWFLPWVEFGMDSDQSAVAARLAAVLTPDTWVTPEIEAEAARVLEGLPAEARDSQQARAIALYRRVNDLLDQRTPRPGVASHALLMREGCATTLYAALLTAAGVEYDLVSARGFPPEADPEPAPAFLDDGYWSGRLLLRVRPDDGRPAWCDLNEDGCRFLPYGRLVDAAPGAPAVVSGSGEFLTVPGLPLEERSGNAFDARLEVAADGSAQAHLVFRILGPQGHLQKLAFRDMPEASRPYVAQNLAAGALPGLDLGDVVFDGLNASGGGADEQRVTIGIDGRLGRFVDVDGSARLPLPPMDLSRAFAVEGQRRLGFLFPRADLRRFATELVLGPGVELLEAPQGFAVPLPGGGLYELDVTASEDGRTWTLRRDLVLAPVILEPGEYEAFVEACRRIDEAERARLRFRLSPP